MKFEDVAKIVDGVPYTSMSRGRAFYDFILKHQPKQCLELGFAHGVSSCYFAAALDELGDDHMLTCVDLESSAENEPNIEALLERCGLSHKVKIVREKTSYTWFLHDEINARTKDNQCQSFYDFCFIDGGKNWTIDGAAFFMVDKLLNKEGWILFDDYKWSYEYQEQTNNLKETDGILHSSLSEGEFKTPQIEEVFKLLVMQHPDYGNFFVEDDIIAFAQKINQEVKTFELKSSASFKYKMISLMKRMMGRKF